MGGLLLASSWPAAAELHWVWAKPATADAVSLRTTLNAPAEFREATLYVTCDNGAKVLLNDRVVATNDDWNSPTKVDLTPYLKPGANQLRAEARNEGGVAGFTARLRIKTKDNQDVVIDSDTHWEAKVAGEGTWQKAISVGRYGSDPWGDPFGFGVAAAGGGAGTSGAAPASLVVAPGDIQTLPGFQVELLHVVPKADQGSWVSMTVDPKGRILACDQYGALYRLTPNPKGSPQPATVERLKSNVGGAHGLLYAFNSLYVMVNEQSGRQGLWRLHDTDGDDQFDKEVQLRRIEGGGEHGPHAVVLSPDGQSIYVACGNHTKLPDHLERSRAARLWEEDQIIPRLWDANGHARGILAPGGYICRTDPEGKVFELVSHGYRNEYDFAFNSLGDIITYDSDMEWDAGMPWYRPTRINLATSGSELGWRSGSGKWPSYYPDSLPALLDIGPGSPTGVESGKGAKFPARYQHAVFANDWTYGTMYAIHLAPQGSAYVATREEFLSGKPLPLTDLVINPADGALYFAIGGRKTQSAVYRVTYTGTESTAPAEPLVPTPEHTLRRSLEKLHDEGTGPSAVTEAWTHLAHPDRWIRFAARTAIERQSPQLWASYVIGESDPYRTIEGAIALARVKFTSARDPLLARLNRIDYAALDEEWRLALVRAYQLAILRLGVPEGATRTAVIQRLDAQFPAKTFALNRELANALIALDAPSATAKTMQLMATARDEEIHFASDALLARNSGYATAFSKAAESRPNQQQIAYAYSLRAAKSGWTPALRRSYFAWFPRTAPWQGGNSFRGFLEMIRKDALALMPEGAERKSLDELSSRKDQAPASPDFAPPKGPGQDYTIEEVLALAGDRLSGRNFEDGRRLFHAAACFTCHPFNGAGGSIGPDLTGAGARYTLRDLLENIIEPSKVISDQYGTEQYTLTDGSTVVGRGYEEGGKLHVVFDPRNPEEKEVVDLAKLASRKPYPVSLMPMGLLNAMNRDEVLNLIAYVQSAGNPQHAVFKK
ncbi:MAG: c-type cytochrome [Verrucomicrobiales bacterium]|nr:c-type cytochrome [Verrucomicrobiales bacterium]